MPAPLSARPLLFTWPLGLAFAAAFVWVQLPEMRIVREARKAQRVAEPGTRDRSLRPLLVGQGVAMALSFTIAVAVPAWAIAWHRLALYWTGVALLVAASLLRRHCFRMLGADFRGAVTVRAEQPVVERGAYRWIRHPSYTAGILFHLAVALALGNWGSVAVGLAISAAAFSYRIHVEERELLGTLGPAYGEYMGRTKRLIPGVW